jgi:hypothetical protein
LCVPFCFNFRRIPEETKRVREIEDWHEQRERKKAMGGRTLFHISHTRQSQSGKMCAIPNEEPSWDSFGPSPSSIQF